MPDLTPEDISNRTFRSTFRGVDGGEVRAYLESLAASFADLTAERDRLQLQAGEGAERDLKSEFESVGRDVAAVLETARDAADQMRERASSDATRWRSEAVAEAEAELRQARADAEQLRSDAWTTSEELLKQSMAEAERISGVTEQERLRLVGESEREAHRVLSSGRRESEELMRTARMESERMALAAQSTHDQVIEQANRASETAQERTRALEVRRNELKTELDEIRHALATAEGELEDRRAAIELSPQTEEVPAIEPESAPPEPGDEEPDSDWSMGETVRVVRPGESAPSRSVSLGKLVSSPEITLLSADDLLQRDSLTDESLEAAIDESSVSDPEPSDSVDPDPSIAVETEIEADPIVSSSEELVSADAEPDVATSEPSSLEHAPVVGLEIGEDASPGESPDGGVLPIEADVDDLGPDDPSERFAELTGLFARLRDPEPTDDPTVAASVPVSEQPPAVESTVDYGGDPFELRSELLLPVSNRALRNIKRQLTEAQNEALEELRLNDGDWEPEGPAMGARLRPDLVVLAAESFAAGHAAAMEMAGLRLKRPSTPKTEPETEWVAGLLTDVGHALTEGRKQGQGARQLGASVSRVYRAWRTDEAERRVAEVAHLAYHTGLVEVARKSDYSVRWVVSGRGCSMCWANAESVPSEWSSVPPTHAACDCTLVLV